MNHKWDSKQQCHIGGMKQIKTYTRKLKILDDIPLVYE